MSRIFSKKDSGDFFDFVLPKHELVVSTTVGGVGLHKKEPIRILFFSFGAKDESKLTYLFAYALQA